MNILKGTKKIGTTDLNRTVKCCNGNEKRGQMPFDMRAFQYS